MLDVLIENKNGVAVMSSVALAKLCMGESKDAHSNFIKKANKVLGAKVVNFYELMEIKGLDGHYKGNRTILMLPEREACLMAMSYSYELQAKVFDAWQALKSQQPALPDFSNPATAARAWAVEFEQKNVLTQQLAMAAPKVDFADRISGTHKGILLGQYAKSAGLGPKKIFGILRRLRILICGGGDHNLPYQTYMDRGYFTVKQRICTGSEGEYILSTTLITGKGEVWLTKKLVSLGVLKPVSA